MTINIDDLYPGASEEELAEARERLEAYVRLVLRLQERLEAERVDAEARRLYDENGRILTSPNPPTTV